MKTKTVIPVLVGALALVAGCGSSPPDAQELAVEVVNAQPDLSDSAKTCMNDVIDSFEVTDAEREAGGGENLNDSAALADEGNEAAQKVMDRFEAELEACNP